MNDTAVQYERVPNWGYVLLSMLIAVFLTVLPVPDQFAYYWPDWITLVVFYWVLVTPAHLGVMFGWMNGLIEDIVTFSLFGQHALSKALVGTVAAAMFKKFWLFNILEKMFLVFITQSISIAITAWSNRLAFDTPVEGVLWLQAVTTALLWPIASLLLGMLNRREG